MSDNLTQHADYELPGMWESADLSGGWADTEDAARTADTVPDCFWCAEERGCRPGAMSSWTMMRMFVCPTCGNKRCPKATDHRLNCTGSNEPGQAGSRYTALIDGTESAPLCQWCGQPLRKNGPCPCTQIDGQEGA